jgi:L-2-hydroxyglutarate oxidase LhgO
MSNSPHVVVIGAGIVGLATAFAIRHARPDARITILEKEDGPARHQTGHNSGVIHSGLYYKPGSRKAALVAEGRELLLAFCDEHEVPYELCGKVVVATELDELARLDTLEQRSSANGVPVKRLDRRALREREPHVDGHEALLVPSAGIVSFPAVCSALVTDLVRDGVDIAFGRPVVSFHEGVDGVEVSAGERTVWADVAVNCAGLQSDRVAALAGTDTAGVRIMPFRGEYYELRPERRDLCRHLVYPLPDPAFPFLGVHLTRMIDGSVHAGPNAVPALAREGYRWRDIDRRDLSEVLGSARTYRLARKYWRTGAGEIHRSLRKAAFVRALQRLCPDVGAADLVESGSGVRAQAIDAQGDLIDDFAFAETPRAVHVVNAPSPAATAAFAIGRHIAEKVLPRLPGSA